MKNVALLAGGASIHTIRWANGLYDAGLNVHLITQHSLLESVRAGVEVTRLPFRGAAGYFLMVPRVRALLRKIKPDVLNAHYASGYGTTARLSRFRPLALSVWGSDVYDVPYQSPFHRRLVVGNLRAADSVLSTSYCMATQVKRLVPHLENVRITPFGVDLTVFKALHAPVIDTPSRPIVIGTVKVLAPKYGIDTLIEAFNQVYRRALTERPDIAQRLQLRIVGDGPQRTELASLAKSLGIEQKVEFVGRVPHSEVPAQLEAMDVFVALSRLDSESFGVAAIEAGAMGKPVVVSEAGGLPEVVLDGVTGYVVARDNVGAAAEAIGKLVYEPGLRAQLGVGGRRHVSETYDWSMCVERMIAELERTSKLRQG